MLQMEKDQKLGLEQSESVSQLNCSPTFLPE